MTRCSRESRRRSCSRSSRIRSHAGDPPAEARRRSSSVRGDRLRCGIADRRSSGGSPIRSPSIRHPVSSGVMNAAERSLLARLRSLAGDAGCGEQKNPRPLGAAEGSRVTSGRDPTRMSPTCNCGIVRVTSWKRNYQIGPLGNCSPRPCDRAVCRGCPGHGGGDRPTAG